MDESFVHQAHGSPYYYFASDENGVVQDGIGRTTGKSLRMIMVHAVTKWAPLAKFCDGFPIEEGWFKETAEFLWQAKLAKGDYHAVMTDLMLMEWLEHRLSPAYNAIPEFEGKQMILVLENASYHHGFDAEVKEPETNTKKYNVDLLHKFGGKSIRVRRKEGEQGVVEYNFEVPTEPGSSFPARNREGGVSRAEVATATRGWVLIWTPPYMPSFQPIELFWQHGKQYVSLNFELKRKMREVWVQIRKANCSKLVEDAIGEMNKLVKDRDGVLSGTIGNLQKPDGCDKNDVSPMGDVEEGGGDAYPYVVHAVAGGLGYWLGVGSMCTAFSNCPLTVATVDFQYTAILTQRVYVSSNLQYKSTCEVSVCSFLHSRRLCVWQSQTSLNPLGLNIQLSSLKASMCLALSNITQPVRFQSVFLGITVSLLVSQYLLRKEKSADAARNAFGDGQGGDKDVEHYNNVDRDDTYTQIARSLSTGRLLASPPMSSEEGSSADEGGGRRGRRDDTESSGDSYSTGESDTESDDEAFLETRATVSGVDIKLGNAAAAQPASSFLLGTATATTAGDESAVVTTQPTQGAPWPSSNDGPRAAPRRRSMFAPGGNRLVYKRAFSARESSSTEGGEEKKCAPKEIRSSILPLTPHAKVYRFRCRIGRLPEVETLAGHLRVQGFVVVASGPLADGRTSIYACARGMGVEALFFAELVFEKEMHELAFTFKCQDERLTSRFVCHMHLRRVIGDHQPIA
ncbi:unnamed protein product [Ectocarpus sp. CCAP 1310/34]|nr:unnamed protein product [Ectocarpus sp. CCAP 1310/34]